MTPLPIQHIHPFLGVGSLRFGMSRARCRSVLDATPEPFEKLVGDTNLVDFYVHLGMQLSFDGSDTLELVELHTPARVAFDGIPLIGAALDRLVADLSDRGHDGQREPAGVLLHTRGFGVYAPLGAVEGVSVHRRGYYADESARPSESG